jgi:hypothetical protein
MEITVKDKMCAFQHDEFFPSAGYLNVMTEQRDLIHILFLIF